MAKEKVEIEVCDAPGCASTEITTKDEPALGYYIFKGMWRGGGGGSPIPRVFACSTEHLGPAVEARLKETW